MNSQAHSALIWTPELSVHMEYLDNQHRSILRLIDTWWNKLNSGKFNATKENLAKIFSFLNRFTQQHLELEERVLDILEDHFDYSPETVAGHKMRHQVFRDDIMGHFHQDIMLRARSGDNGMDQLRPIAKWWVSHIKTEDRGYADVLAALTPERREDLYVHLIDSLLNRPIVIVGYKQFIKALRQTS
ncbi:hemerythrin domain-containing protein [Pseudodesulfovibrio indicus]|uniref:bacteriohemerythrin n=1 Tax=Pseudodesulfovibrio indicus TaxID=1716143 RepID=UPI00292DF81D|nr:hemerythrin domain-containing protein [Pseudodesulfovibrio indicus]